MAEFNINLESSVGNFSFQFLVGTNPYQHIIFLVTIGAENVAWTGVGKGWAQLAARGLP